MKIIGLTGGLASGKSECARYFREHDIPVVNLDDVGRIVTETTEVRDYLSKRFGSPVVGERVDRVALRKLLFESPEDRRHFEAFLHPLVWKEFRRLAEEHGKRGSRIVLCEAALLVESKHYEKLDGLIVVTAPANLRRERAKTRDGISDSLLDAIQGAQVDDAIREKAATAVIRNDGNHDHLKKQVDDLVAQWRKSGII